MLSRSVLRAVAAMAGSFLPADWDILGARLALRSPLRRRGPMVSMMACHGRAVQWFPINEGRTGRAVA